MPELKIYGNHENRDIYDDSNVCGVLPVDKFGINDFMQLFASNQAMHQLAMVIGVHCFGDVLWMADLHVLKRALEFWVEVFEGGNGG